MVLCLFSREAINHKLVKSPQVERKANASDPSREGTVIADLSLDVVPPPQVLEDVDVFIDGTSQTCPLRIALEAIEKSWTPRKIVAYTWRVVKS